MTYRDVLHALADDTEAQVVALFNAWQAGRIDRETFIDLLASAVAAANQRAASTAALSLAAAITAALGRAVAPMGLRPPDDDHTRLVGAATTLAALPTVTPERVARVGRAEPMATAQAAYVTGMDSTPLVRGYRRGLSPKACKLCVDWAEDGHIFPAGVEMAHHTGCSCTPIPVIGENIS